MPGNFGCNPTPVEIRTESLTRLPLPFPCLRLNFLNNSLPYPYVLYFTYWTHTHGCTPNPNEHNSEKTSEQLIRLLVKAFSKVSDIFAKQVRGHDDLGTLVDRVVQFLRSVKYQPSVDQQTFLSGLANGDPDIVYPIFKWFLHPSQKGQIGERAFVGYYLSDLPLPDDLLNDYDCIEIRQQIKVLQNKFIQKHKEVSERRKKGQDPNEVKRTIAKMEQEQELLHKRIEKTVAKVKAKVHRERLDELKEVCSALRRQQDEESYLRSAMDQQHYQFEVAEEKYNAAVSKLQEIKQNLSTEVSSPESLLMSLQEETKENRIAVNERLPRETEQKQKQLSILQYVLQESSKGEGWSEGRLHELHMSNAEKKSDIEELQSRTADSMRENAGDIQLVQQRQMANMVSRKKQELARTVEELLDQKERLAREYEEKVSENEVKEVQEPSYTEEEMASLKSRVKGLTKTYQELKAGLTELNAEQLVLERTQSILYQMEGSTGRDPSSELSRTAKQIGEVSVAKSEVDEMKSAQLEKISGLVHDINKSIKERKAKLAPQIKELRTFRANYKELEDTYTRKKKENQANMTNFEARIGKLAREEKQLRTTVNQNETMYHLLNCSSKLLATYQRRASNPTVADRVLKKYEDKIQQQEELLSKCRDRTGDLEQNHSASVDQVASMQGLLKLLNLKLDHLSRGNVGDARGAATDFETGAGNVLQF